LKQDSLITTNPAQEFLIYLPPCYQAIDSRSYPVLYLLHGQTYTDDQWVRIGAVDHADRMILSGEIPPFIIVFPDDRYWNLPPGPGFGDRLLDLVPYVDKNYRTLEDREHRAIGGLSHGGGWVIRLGLTHPDIFGALGLHSPAVLLGDDGYIESWIRKIPEASMPRLWLDIGDRDKELGNARLMDMILSDNDFPHEFYVYLGEHTEAYWSSHMEKYLRWYGVGWQAIP
jgi:enterochelin esterase family protein